MINEWLAPELKALGILDTIILQQDGALPLFAFSVRKRLNELLPNRWIGPGSPICPVPTPWPPRRI